MDDDEGDDRPGQDEVDAARRLASAEQVQQPWRGGVDAWRHGQARQQHQRQHDDDADVGELLQHIVGPRLLPLREFEAQMIPDRVADAAQLQTGRQEVAAEVAGEDAPQQIDQAVDDEDPGEGEMPEAAGGQVLPARHGGPGGKAVRQGEPVMVCVGALEAPVERPVRVEDLEAAHQHQGDADHVDPVGDAHDQRMTVEGLAWGHRASLPACGRRAG